MTCYTVLFDACVMYPAPLRSYLMYLSNTGLFRASCSVLNGQSKYMMNGSGIYFKITPLLDLSNLIGLDD